MKRNPHSLFALSAIVLASSAAWADAFPQFDIRALGMGGTGVASARPASAAAFNPAMLSASRESDAFQIAFGAGVRLGDPDELLDVVDDVQDDIDELETIVNDIEANPPLPDTNDPRLLELSQSGNTVLGELQDLDGGRIHVDAGGSIGFGVPGQTLGFGIYTQASVFALFGPNLAATDEAYLQDIFDDFADSQWNPQDDDADPTAEFPSESSVTVLAVVVRETGIGLSHSFNFGGGLSVGITPKKLTITSYDYSDTIENFDDSEFDADDYEAEDSATDFDVGAVYRLSADSPWQLGLTVKNVKGSSFETIAGAKFDIERQVRAGFARHGETLSFAADVDLVEYDGFDASGGSRFLSLGGELDISFFQLRVGYRAEMGDSDQDNLLTAGIGLGPFDFAILKSGDDIGGGLRIAFGW